MADELALDAGDLLITDNGDIITLSESNVYDDIIRFRLSINIASSFRHAINQVVDFRKGL